MVENVRTILAGIRLLVVEDEYLIASDLAFVLEGAGAEVIGPAGTVEDALALVDSGGARLNGAVLDVNLRDARVFPVADALAAIGVPFVLTTGYDISAIPAAYIQAPRCEKPIDTLQLIRLLSSQLGRSGDSLSQAILSEGARRAE
jgi:DNA-binding NtrC family response regulator